MGKRASREVLTDIVFIGAGRLATQLATALHDSGRQRIAVVWSRTMASAQTLAEKVGATATDDIGALAQHTPGTFIIALKDDALPTVAAQLAKAYPDAVMLHTAGSVPMDVLTARHRGVLYPLQTFSKERRVEFARIPFFIEASDETALETAMSIAKAVSNDVTTMDSDRRRQVHLAAVFACNFANHCYTLAADIMERAGVTFSALLPLIEETAAKVGEMHPREAQTGPAVRYDKSVIERQGRMLENDKLTQQIYELMSKSIHNHSHR